jgi:hypothetical protein
VSRQASVAGAPSPAYGDWTKPRSGDVALAPDFDLESPAASRLRMPPATTAIPERSVAGRRERAGDSLVDDAPGRTPAEPPVRGSGTGPVIGGRAALRAERQAADVARRKAEKQRGGGRGAVRDDEDGGRRTSRRAVKGLVAMAVVALGVLGVYSFVSPDTKDVAAQTPATPTAGQSPAAPSQPLPALQTEPLTVDPPVVAPVRVPVTVLNSTDINGLAGKIAAAVVAAGWESPGVGAYEGGDVAASTVYFTEGDETQRQAAVQLVDQFPQLQGPAPRFFELPAGVTAPGLVVVATGDWQP